MPEITHYILGCPTNEPESNGHTPWNYFRSWGKEFKGRFLVTQCTTNTHKALKYYSLTAAMNRRENIWGPGWEVLAMPALEVIDHKLYGQNIRNETTA